MRLWFSFSILLLTETKLKSIFRQVSASGVGAGSIPATVLVPIAFLFLTLIRWIGQTLLEVPMWHEKIGLNTNNRTVKRLILAAIKPTAYLLETFWAVGASVVATMVTPPSTH